MKYNAVVAAAKRGARGVSFGGIALGLAGILISLGVPWFVTRRTPRDDL